MRTRGSKKAALLLFWDFDAQWGADRSRLAGGPKDWGRLDFEHTDTLLEWHACFNVPACFAVVGATAVAGSRPYHDPAIVRRIHNGGHEIASHSFRHEWLPGLNRRSLNESLRDSKDALEQCIGAPVTAFVPPFNQPFDYPEGLSISWSERRTARRGRTGLASLCQALAETGHRFCRVAYRPLPLRLAEAVLGRRLDRPGHVASIRGVQCVRLNTPGGFTAESVSMLVRCSEVGGIAVVYGHPHSLGSGNSQDARYLLPFLKCVDDLRRAGRIVPLQPRDIISDQEQ